MDMAFRHLRGVFSSIPVAAKKSSSYHFIGREKDAPDYYRKNLKGQRALFRHSAPSAKNLGPPT